tara:strand:+ start:328 stop:852 length:525 start_codon:yes stop_codon:yes gene_type:complete
MSGIDKEIMNSEDIDLSGQDIKAITNNKARVISYHELANISSLDELMGINKAVILLYETKENFGHWTALFTIDDNTVEFFDSYGFAPDQELNYATYNDTPYLSNLMKSSGYNFIYNDKKLQTFAHDINTCGRWTSLRVRMRDIPLKQFIALWTKNKHYQPDFWVSAITYLFRGN